MEQAKESTRDLLRKKDLVERSGVAKTTLTDWIDEFSPYVPVVRQGRTKYYTETSLEVIERIRDLRTNDYDKVQIAEILSREYAISVDEVERKAEALRKDKDARDAVYLAMQTVGEMSERLEKYEKAQEDMRKSFGEVSAELEKRIEQQNRLIEKQNDYIKTSLDERDRNLTEYMRQAIEERKKKNVLNRIKEAVTGVFKN